MIFKLYRAERPLAFFGIAGLISAALGVVLAVPVFATYLETGLVPRLPTAVLAMGLVIIALLLASSGLVLDTVTRGRREAKLLAYLAAK